MIDLHHVANVIADVISKGGDPLDIAKVLAKKGLLAKTPGLIARSQVINIIESGSPQPSIRFDHIAEAYRAGRRSRP